MKSGDAFVCLFKHCVRLFEKCTFEYKVGKPRYDYVFIFVLYLKSSPLSESDESDPSGGVSVCLVV